MVNDEPFSRCKYHIVKYITFADLKAVTCNICCFFNKSSKWLSFHRSCNVYLRRNFPYGTDLEDTDYDDHCDKVLVHQPHPSSFGTAFHDVFTFLISSKTGLLLSIWKHLSWSFQLPRLVSHVVSVCNMYATPSSASHNVHNSMNTQSNTTVVLSCLPLLQCSPHFQTPVRYTSTVKRRKE